MVIGERRAAATIDGSSTLNLISIEVVEKLQLPTCARTVPYLLHSSYGTLLISHTADIPITFGAHTEVVRCDVSPMPLDSCHVLLGDHWCRKFQVQPCHQVNKISFKWNMKRRALLRAPADKFHEYHLLRKGRTKEFCLFAKYKVIMHGDISVICHFKHDVHHNPCENESHIAKLTESFIKSELCDPTKREVESIHSESKRETNNMSVVDDRTCEDFSTNVIISTSGVVSSDLQVVFEERELDVQQPASFEEVSMVPPYTCEDVSEQSAVFELQPATTKFCESNPLLVNSCDLICTHVTTPCDKLQILDFDHVLLLTHK